MDEQNPPRDTGVSERNARARGGGRPEYKPTDDQRSQVRQLAAARTARIEIARQLGISPVTLRKHFARELAGEQQPDQAPEQALPLEGAHTPKRIDGPADQSAGQPVGRPEFEPTQRQREDVKLCKADEWSDDRIARQLGISRNTLLKHFAEELAYGADQVRMRNLRNLQRLADAGSVPACRELLEMSEGGAEMLPVPSAPPAEHEAPLGKKEQATRDARTAHEGTSWNQILN